MKQLNINITKAELKSYTVRLEEGKPVVEATIELLTAGGMSVTTYSVSTSHWRKEDEFELPLAAIAPIVELAKILEHATVEKCRDSQLALVSGVKEDPIKEEDLMPLAIEPEYDTTIVLPRREVRLRPIREDDEELPIDLSEIPF